MPRSSTLAFGVSVRSSIGLELMLLGSRTER